MNIKYCDVCANHDEFKEDIKLVQEVIRNLSQWQAIEERNNNNTERILEEIKVQLKENTLTLQETKLSLKGDYVSKVDFDRFVKSIDQRFNTQSKEFSNTMWKVAGIVFTLGGAAFGIIQWVISLLLVTPK